MRDRPSHFVGGMHMGRESRRSPRIGLDLLYVNKIIGDEPHLARARDISVDGIFLYRLLEPELDAEGRVGLEMMLPDGEDVIWAVAEIVRNEEQKLTEGVALRFVRIAETDRERIRRYVAERADTANRELRANISAA
jgi:c-di-GMP-binding flagellar brake protein YcgR